MMFVSDVCATCHQTVCCCPQPNMRALWGGCKNDKACQCTSADQQLACANKKLTCGNCRYSHEGNYSWELLCLRRSPVIVTRYGQCGSRETKSEWPQIKADNWCGEHELK